MSPAADRRPRCRMIRGACIAAAFALLAGALWWNPLGWWQEPPRLPLKDFALELPVAAAVPWDAPLPRLAPSSHRGPQEEYRRRLSRWQLENFRADLRRLRGLERAPRGQIEVAVRLHRQPMSPPSIVSDLGPQAARERARIESQVLESTMEVQVPGVGAEELLRFHVFSMFELEGEDPGNTLAIEITGPLSATPLHMAITGAEIPANQGLRREVTGRIFLKRPTGYTNSIVYDDAGTVKIYRYELLVDEPPPGGGEVLLSAGVFMTRALGDGAILWHHSYYHGQDIPAWMEALAIQRIRSCYRAYARQYHQRSRAWIRAHPSPSPARAHAGPAPAH